MRLPVTPSTRLLLVAGALVAGEACGFALHGAAVLWPWLTFLLGLALLADRVRPVDRRFAKGCKR